MQQPTLTLGTTKGLFARRPFRLEPLNVATHKLVSGQTGQGKSKLLATIFVQLIEQGEAVSLIDPHSDLATDVIGMLADRGYFNDIRNRDKFRYIPFGRDDCYLPFNILTQPMYRDDEIAEQVAEVCMRVWPALADGSAPLFENIVKYGTMILIQNKLPLNRLPDVLIDSDYREMLLETVTDEQVRKFFHLQYDAWGKDAPQMRQSTLSRVDLLTFSLTLRYCLGQRENALPFREFMDEGMSVIYDLGHLTRQTQSFLGAMIMTGYEMAALSRDDDHRRHHHLIIDEFANFSSKSGEALSTMLSQTRKYGLFATLAHQSWGQLEGLQDALQNCKIKIAFGLDYDDALRTAKIIGRVDPKGIMRRHGDTSESEGMAEQWQVLIQDLQDLHPGTAYVRKLIAQLGEPWKRIWKRPPSKLYKIKTVRVPKPRTPSQLIEAIKENYAQALMTPAADVAAFVDSPPMERVTPKRYG